MTTISLVATDQLLSVALNPVITSGNVNSILLHVDFDETWNGYARSGVFFTSNDSTPHEEVMINNECTIQSEVLKDSGILYIGVRGVNSNANQVKTSSLVRYKITDGTPSGEGTEVAPSANIYQQLLSAYGVLEARMNAFASLQEGSTTGDAELLDIRVDVKGNAHETAGEAVRAQVSNLSSEIVDSSKGIRLLDSLVTGNLGSDGMLDTSWLSRISTQEFIVYNVDVCLIIDKANDYNCIVCTYDSDYALINRVAYADAKTIVIPANTVFRITIYKSGDSADVAVDINVFRYGVVIKTELLQKIDENANEILKLSTSNDNKIDKSVLNPKMGFLKIPEKLNISYDGTNVFLQGEAWVIYPNGAASEFLTVDTSIDATDLIIITAYFDLTSRNIVLCGAISSSDFDYNNYIFLFNFSFNKITNKFVYLSSPIHNLHFNGEKILPEAKITETKKERPDDGIVQITVTVDGQEDYGVLYLPQNYSSTGDPVQLVINCHGAGSEFTADKYALAAPGKNLPDFGYAVCDINANLNKVDTKGQHWGDPYAIRSYLALYDYVTKNYNVTKEIFVMGTSMGGTTSNYLVNLTSIPVKAQAGFCTIVDVGKSIFLAPPYTYTTIRNAVNTSFGFSDFEFTNDSVQCTQEEFEHFVENSDKITGYNPIQFSCINWCEVNPYEKALRSTVTDSTWQESRDEEAVRYDKLISTHKCPIKIWHCADDGTVPYRYGKYYIEALKRGGCVAEFREFATGAHNAYDNAEYTKELTKIDGTTGIYNASTVELLEWFKRWQ